MPPGSYKNPKWDSHPCAYNGCKSTFPIMSKHAKHLRESHKLSEDEIEDMLGAWGYVSYPCGYNGCESTFIVMWRLANHPREEHELSEDEIEEMLGASGYVAKEDE